MLVAVGGIAQGNVVVTLLNRPKEITKKARVDWDSFVIPSERGKNVDEYMREMRENDRLKEAPTDERII